jgi:hypothetical protein
MIEINLSFGEFFTPLVILVSKLRTVMGGREVRERNDLEMLREMRMGEKTHETDTNNPIN